MTELQYPAKNMRAKIPLSSRPTPKRVKKEEEGRSKKKFTASLLLAAIGVCLSGTAYGRNTTPPIIKPIVTGTLGLNGWYTDNVSVSWSVTATGSKITNTSGCDPLTVTTDTPGTTFTCKATSRGTTTSQSVTIKRDATPPKAAITTPGNSAVYTQNQSVKAIFSCTDATAGVNACTGTVTNGSNIDTATIGTKNFSVQVADNAGNMSISSTSYSVGEMQVATVAGAHLFAWNDLGMHCADSDYSVFTLLPPFNDLTAQLVVNGKLVSTDYQLTYTATTDPTGSINSTSRNKTNFWTYAQALFGNNLAEDVGLTGNPTPSTTPAPMLWEPTYNWFEASGLPITPIDDSLETNYYPMVKVTALDSAGKAIASSNTVLPISSEINCKTCHASITGSSSARPAGGWVNLAPGSEQDWRMNILRLHDEKNAGSNYTNLLLQKGYGESLEASVSANGKPILCDSCHNSNALAVWGIKGTSGVSNMTTAMHNRHANVTLPGATQTLNSMTTRVACYNCHPGEKTQCLRGAMGNAINTAGEHTMECQSCHGSMTTVGNKAREGWIDMPTCQSCHHDGIRETTAINTDGTFKTWPDARFASNPDTPEQNISLYRFSTGHGALQCEACHNSTHAEFTNLSSTTDNQKNDNLQAINAQGYAAAIRECTVCHTTMPNSANGGPHGMHNLGQSWVTAHQGSFGTVNKTTCYYCHGNTASGSPLAVIKVAKTFNIEDRGSKTFAANERVTCWSCHNGPNP